MNAFVWTILALNVTGLLANTAAAAAKYVTPGESCGWAIAGAAANAGIITWGLYLLWHT